MKTVKIYKVTRTRTYLINEQGTGYSLQPWGRDTEQYKGYDDGGKDYILPDGYEVAESPNSGPPEIYNAEGTHCPLTTNFDSPCIIDGSREIMLKRLSNDQ